MVFYICQIYSILYSFGMKFFTQILSRVKPAVEQQLEKTKPTNHKITAKDFIEKRDYTGALTILKVGIHF